MIIMDSGRIANEVYFIKWGFFIYLLDGFVTLRFKHSSSSFIPIDVVPSLISVAAWQHWLSQKLTKTHYSLVTYILVIDITFAFWLFETSALRNSARFADNINAKVGTASQNMDSFRAKLWFQINLGTTSLRCCPPESNFFVWHVLFNCQIAQFFQSFHWKIRVIFDSIECQ